MEENNLINSSPSSESHDSGLMPIENLIHIIRGQQVMLDSDLARLYGVETKYLKRAVKANIKRFPSDFMFELVPSEFNSLRCENCTSNDKSQRGGTRYMPFVFTEQGVAMLSGVLKSDTAIEVNIRIMRAFIAMRSFIMSNAQIFQRLETVEHHQLLMQKHQSETDRKIEEILSHLDDKEAEPIEGFFYEGQIFDAYTLISDLVRKADTRIILIDNYVDDRVLKTLDKRKDGVSAIVFTNPRNSQINLDIRRHNAQYPAINLRHCTNVHDRFLIIDDTVYFIGGSIKDLGKKIVAFSQMHQSPDDILSKIR